MNYSAFDDCAAHYQRVGHDIEDAAKSLNLRPEKFALCDRIDSQRCVNDAPRQNPMSLRRFDRLHIRSEQAGCWPSCGKRSSSNRCLLAIMSLLVWADNGRPRFKNHARRQVGEETMPGALS